MGKYSSHKVYKNKKGTEVPSVTTVLHILNKPALTKWANIMGFKRRRVEDILERASNIGTVTHECLESFLKGEKYSLPDKFKDYKEDLYRRLDGFITWYKENELKASMLEVELVDDDYGGTCDFYGTLNEKNVVLDFKTSSKVHGSMFLQLAGYIIILEKQKVPVDGAGILHIRDGKTTLHYFSRDRMEPYIEVYKVLVKLFHGWYDLSEKDGWGDIIGK